MKQKPKGRPLVSFRDVTLQLRDRRILERIDWSVRGDEHWAILGGNGSGKSVLARAIYGVVPVVVGEIVYHLLEEGKPGGGGRRHLEPEDLIAHVSFEDQKYLVGAESSYSQARWNSIETDNMLTARDVLSGAAVGAGKKRSRKTGVVGRLGIDHLLDRKIAHLSNGEVRKVLIARALLRSPSILILDDPFVGLDYRSGRAFGKMVDELMKGAMRVVFVTSNVDEIPSRTTHLLWLKDGGIAAAGDRKTVLDAMRPKRPSVRKTKSPRRRRTVGQPRTLVEIRDASVTYDDVEVLKGINWTIRQGENWAVLGPNGSGKTTLLSLIMGDNPQAYSNDIYLFGRKRGSGESIWDIKRKIGLVSPDIQIHYQKHITSHEVVCSGFFDSIGLYDECSARQERLAAAWIERLRLSELADRRFDELSAGQQRMVLIARASVKEPRLLILDEPCQGLDIENREIVLETVEAIGRRGTSNLIYVTHRLSEIPDSVSHVLRLRKGRVVNRGSRERVLAK